MREVDFDEHTHMLLVNQNGRLRALGGRCPHRGAPLHKGVLSNGRVRCPWHGACFDLETGDIENFPGLDSLPCHRMAVDSKGQVLVRAKRSQLSKTSRIKEMAVRQCRDQRCFVVVGGGPSGAVCVENLRQEGFTGRLILVCRERYLPYDRVEVMNFQAKSMDQLCFRDEKFYRDHDIEVRRGVSAKKLDTLRKELHCSNGKVLQYDKIYLATGYSAVRPDIPGVELGNVKTIRDICDARSIFNMVNTKTRVVCLGSSFMAVEAAAHLVSRAGSVTLVARQNVPFKTHLGEQIGRRILQLLEDNGVHLRMNSDIARILENPLGQVKKVELVDRSRIPCDLLILGTGCQCNTEFLIDSGVSVNPNGSVNVNDFLETNVRHVYAGGDIANAYILGGYKDRVNISHYGLAQYHGRVAAMNMCGHIKKVEEIPFFYTIIFGKAFRSAGYGDYREVIIDGSLEDLQFVAYFVDNKDVVTAVASCGRDSVVAKFAELISQGKGLWLCQIADPKKRNKWLSLITP
ncbi:apoptosis-inducing factor 3 [Drosophila kikkawai]|uniref:Apoptosis-inducing factor 3 n=1 Tax=Drosophila kikkawai TaxID=30033 RepID=A0A6P4IYH4_DROKI|nr:apoptosis-inducing factor 3 [Drosophila kikkawai]